MFQSAISRIRRGGRKNLLILGVFLILLIIVILNIGKKNATVSDTATSTKEVSVASVAALAGESSPVSLLGTVTSRSEATIRAEVSGRVTVYKKLGDNVAAGTVIAEFENSGERAAVLVAEGAYDAVLAQKNIAVIGRGSSGLTLDEAKTGALNALDSTYTTLDDAVRTKTDPLFSNPNQRDAKLIVQSSDSRVAMRVEEERLALTPILTARAERNRSLSPDADLTFELTAIESEAHKVSDFLEDLTLVLNKAIPDAAMPQSAIDGHKASVAGARSAVAGTLSALAGARNALNGAVAASAVAEETSGSMGGQTTATDAAIKSALGNLRGAQSRLEKTVVRSPISGTINALPVTTGDSLSPGADIATVAQNGALEIVAYATEDDARAITIGRPVAVEGDATGVVTRIAPALDPQTKKIEVRIGITSGVAKLINGQSAHVFLARADKSAASGSKTITIPLSALKIMPLGAYVFTVDDAGKLVAHLVKEGRLQGDRIEIVEGLTPDMIIVTDARGLKEGSQVTIKA